MARETSLFDDGSARVTAVQEALIGQPREVRIAAAVWGQWLNDPATQERYRAKIYLSSVPAVPCQFFIGAISSTGHGSFRAGSLPDRTRRGTVPAHLYGYQLAHGVIERLGWEPTTPTVAHTCDEASCQRPDHLRLVSNAENSAEWAVRRRNPRGPLADLRGAAGRARAIADAIRAGLAAGDSAHQVADRITAAQAEGLPLTLW